MSDLVLIAVIVTFFVAAAQLVRACGSITAGATEEGEQEAGSELEPGSGT